jgi:hypothetical protein
MIRSSLAWSILSGLFLAIGATLFLSAAWEPFHLNLIHVLENETALLGAIGLLFIFFSFGLQSIVIKSRPSFRRILYRPHKSADDPGLEIEVTQKTLKKGAESYFLSHFPQTRVKCETHIYPKMIAVSAFLPKTELEIQKDTLLQIERELPPYLADQVGWTGSIQLSVHFPN